MLLSVAFVSASFDVDGIGNLNERYVFHVVPLLFVGLALWIERGSPPAPVVVARPGGRVPRARPPPDRPARLQRGGLRALALVPWDALSLNAAGTALLVGLVTIGAGALWLTARPGATARLWALLAIWLAVLGVFVIDSNRASARHRRRLRRPRGDLDRRRGAVREPCGGALGRDAGAEGPA